MTHQFLFFAGCGLAVITIGVAALLYIALRSRHKKSALGDLHLIGSIASVTTPLAPEGAILVAGELWNARARSGAPIAPGPNNVRVVGARGHLLEVESRCQMLDFRC